MMGGKLSCVRSNPSSKDSDEEKEPRPNQYEEIDDNFTILPGGQTQVQTVAAAPQQATSTYENVILPSTGNPPHRGDVTSENATTNEIHRNGDACYQQTDVTSSKFETIYANQSIAVQSTPANEIHPTVTKTTNHSATNGVSPHSSNIHNGVTPGATTDVYSQVIKPKNKGGDKNKSSEPKGPPPRVKPKVIALKETDTPQVKGQQLNYIEVEFSSKPASKKADPSTTYTDVVHEGGRLVLIQ